MCERTFKDGEEEGKRVVAGARIQNEESTSVRRSGGQGLGVRECPVRLQGEASASGVPIPRNDAGQPSKRGQVEAIRLGGRVRGGRQCEEGLGLRGLRLQELGVTAEGARAAGVQAPECAWATDRGLRLRTASPGGAVREPKTAPPRPVPVKKA